MISFYLAMLTCTTRILYTSIFQRNPPYAGFQRDHWGLDAINAALATRVRSQEVAYLD